MLRRLAADGFRPRPKSRRSVWVPSIASLYGQTALRQENAYLSIGERCNANGSKQFRQLQEKGDWDGCVEMAREQVKEGSHALDLCTAFVGRDEIADMSEAVTRMRGSVNAPLVIDSTELPVLEAALKLYGGKPIFNSINFEDGEGPGGQAPRARPPLRHRGHRAHHRRAGHGQGGRAQARDRPPALRFRLQAPRPAARRI